MWNQQCGVIQHCQNQATAQRCMVMRGRTPGQIAGVLLGAVVFGALPMWVVGELITSHNVEVCEKATGKYCDSRDVGTDALTYRGPIWLMSAAVLAIWGLGTEPK